MERQNGGLKNGACMWGNDQVRVECNGCSESGGNGRRRDKRNTGIKRDDGINRDTSGDAGFRNNDRNAEIKERVKLHETEIKEGHTHTCN